MCWMRCRWGSNPRCPPQDCSRRRRLGVAVPLTCKQPWRCSMRRRRAMCKQWNLRTPTGRPATEATSSSEVVRRGPRGRSADWSPILPDWCFCTDCTSTIGTSPAAEAPGRVRPCHPSPGKGRGWPGPDGSNVTLSDSDAIRVRVRAGRARPCRSGEAEGSRRAGPGRAPRRDGCGEEVAAGGRPGHRGDVLTWSFSTRAHWRAGVAAAPRVEPAGVLA